MNMENHANIKLDYLNFRSENTSRFFHRLASRNDEILEKKIISNILQVNREIGDNRVFPLQPPEFGIIRGEVLSTMICEEKTYKVDPNPPFCTEEIQTFDENDNKTYIAMNSRVVQEEYSKIDCPTADMASVFSGRTKQGSEVHTIQKPERVDFHTEFISGPAIEHNHFYDRKKVNLTRQLSFVPFDKSGIYSEEYLKKRRETMFRTVEEKTVGKGVVRTFAPDLGDWEVIAEGGLDILGKIPYDGLIDAMFGTAWIRGLLSFLQVIGYVGSTFGFLQFLKKLYQWWLHRDRRNRPGRGARRRRARRRARRLREEDLPMDGYAPPAYTDDWV